MARRKTPLSSVRTKHVLAERIMALRVDLFGPRGGPELARRLGIPVRTWYNYEGGITVPGEIILKIIEVTSVEPMWLLHGTGPKFSEPRHDPGQTTPSSAMNTDTMMASAAKYEMPASPTVAVRNLLKAALRLLGNDQGETSEPAETPLRRADPDGQTATIDLEALLLERNAPRNGRSSGNGTG
jgi:hypothetical protein